MANGVTLLTVAHRLQTIMDYDKLVSRTPYCLSRVLLILSQLVQMVLDAGRLVSDL